jgi:hypothetical protein
MRPIFLQKWLPRWKPNINSVEVHPQESNNGHPVDGALGSIGTSIYLFIYFIFIFFLGVKFCHFFDKEIADILDFFFCLSSVISTNFFLHF